ncbi:MAG: nucleotidyl transferase AbiEii/AbiGii toxin family protein [Acidobacteria bacterium]|nr:nucleotidyl transferase AbiEii/AbiGii toxin family protein [Acidobacteriota bacterium]
MNLPLIRPTSREALLVWVLHRFAEEFNERAILKGGLLLRLLDSPRDTNDADFVFAPYRSKRQIAPRVKAILEEIDDAEVDVRLHSTMLRAAIRVDGVGVQVGCSVADECRSIAMTTASMAEANGYPPRVVRAMDLSVALAHKLAAWNERRLVRDLYDAYFFVARVGVSPDMPTLEERLSKMRSNRPELKRVRSMTIAAFSRALEAALANLTDRAIDEELGGLIPAASRAGLSLQIRAALNGLLQTLE